MTKDLHGMLIGGAVFACASLLVFPAAAQTVLSKEMGKKWGDKCAPTGHATTCCFTERNNESACKGLEKERLGSPVVRNCDDAEKICQGMVRSASDAKKAEEEKKKKAEDAKKADDSKKVEEKKTAPQGLPRLPSAADLERQIDDVKNDAARIDEQLSKVASKADLEELKRRANRDQETLARIKTILEGPPRSVIETNPPDWTVPKQKVIDVGAKVEAVQKKILHCVLAGDATGGDSKDGKTAPPTNIDSGMKGKHVVGCKF